MVVQLREAFQDEDYDHRLLDEIKARTQGPDEKVIPFISKIEGLFNRLSRPITEVDKIKIVERNVLPDFQRLLRLTRYNTMRELEAQLKNLEIGFTRSTGYRPPPTKNVMEPDMSYNQENTTYRNKGIMSETNSTTHHHVNPLMDQQNNPNFSSSPRFNRPAKFDYGSPVTCWNCQETGHRFRQCRVPWRRFCHVCGEPGNEARTCRKCRRISGNDASPAYPEPARASARNQLRPSRPYANPIEADVNIILPAPANLQ
ncbi:hypothetical protein WDU94_013889 [Cyamophila willieti]